ncbi:MAG: tetratricopeptide repeat protein, partial [Nitrospirales bacterium]|nr:tetratricopeptide repeat protein [Nitrospirales bacterium]
MHNILAAKYVLSIPVMIFFLIVAGCGKPAHRQDRSQDLDRKAQEQVLRNARVDFEQGRDSKVINDLNRFLSVHPQSPREREVRWLLAQSYERTGRNRAALKQYQIISKELSSGQEKQEVAKRIDELEQRLKKVGTQSEPINVVRISLSQFSRLANDRAILKRLLQEGVTSVLVDFGCPEKSVPHTQPAVKTRDLSTQSQLGLSVAQVHQQNLLAIVGINLRCLGYLDSRTPKQWLDGSFNPVSGKVQPSRYFDIFHPQYQKLMAYEIKKMTDSGIDGIVFLAEAPMGMYDGFTPGSVETFNKTFHTQMNPHTVFGDGVSQRNSQTFPDQNPHVRVSATEAAEFWRWTGWKARQRLIVLQGLMDQVYAHKPAISFGLELHPESIEDPLWALTRFSEDFLEAKQKSFRFFLITPQSGRKIQSQPSPPTPIALEDFSKESRTLVDRMTLVLPNPSRIWLEIP